MLQSLSAHYLAIDWLEDVVPRNIRVSPQTISIESVGDNHFEVETEIFNEGFAWIGFRYSGSGVPCLRANSGKRHALTKISHPTKGDWWVFISDFEGARKRPVSELTRTSGIFRLEFGDMYLRVRNVITLLESEDIQEYVDDLDGDLGWLIINSKSGGTAGMSLIDDRFMRLVGELLEAAKLVAAKPSVTLRETIGNVDRRKIRPVAATIRQISKGVFSTRLPGKIQLESYDTPENGYLLHIVKQVRSFERLWLDATSKRIQLLERLAERERSLSIRLRQIDEIAVDEAVFDAQTARVESSIEELKEYRVQSRQSGTSVRTLRTAKLDTMQRGEGFFIDANVTEHADGEEFAGYAMLLLGTGVQGMRRLYTLLSILRPHLSELSFKGQVTSAMRKDKKNMKFERIQLLGVNGISVSTDYVQKRQATRDRFVKNGWKKRLSEREKQIFRKDAVAAQDRGRLAESSAQRLAETELSTRQNILSFDEISSQLELVGVKPRAELPTGMRIISDPAYARVISIHAEIRTLLKEAGISPDILDKVEQFGLSHTSDIYEKWCLVKIIKVLMTDWKFSPQINWLEKLVLYPTSEMDEPLRIEFSHPQIPVVATVVWQAKMQTGRRPDFVVEWKSTKDASIKSATVIDAKFRTQWVRESPSAMVAHLADVKGYGEYGERCQVFIVQPCRNTVTPPASPLHWGRNCQYGSRNVHSTGWIQLSKFSGQGNHSEDNLKRLLALSYQYFMTLEFEQRDTFEPPPSYQDFESLSDSPPAPQTPDAMCISCGGKMTGTTYMTKRGFEAYRFSCVQCREVAEKTHCFDCGTDIFKLGMRWTFHETVAEDITNVMCPSCGSYFIDKRKAAEEDAIPF